MYHDVDQTVFEWGGPQNEWERESQEFSNEYASQGENPLNEMQEYELASRFLEVKSEEELEAFLGELIGESTGSRRKRSPFWQKLGQGLKGVAGKLLPLAGKVAGGFFGGPLGAKIGGQIGSFAGKAFGMELEGLSAEDREFEVAKEFVRYAAASAQEVAKNAVAGQPPTVAVQKGMTDAAKKHMPSLLSPTGKPPMASAPHQLPLPQMKRRRGAWTLHGDRIVIQL